MLEELGVHVPFLMKNFTNNLGASFISRNPVGHIRLKHVTLDLHFVRERMEKGELVVEHIPRIKQWADILTKALVPKSFLSLQSNFFGICPLSSKGGEAC